MYLFVMLLKVNVLMEENVLMDLDLPSIAIVLQVREKKLFLHWTFDDRIKKYVLGKSRDFAHRKMIKNIMTVLVILQSFLKQSIHIFYLYIS